MTFRDLDNGTQLKKQNVVSNCFPLGFKWQIGAQHIVEFYHLDTYAVQKTN